MPSPHHFVSLSEYIYSMVRYSAIVIAFKMYIHERLYLCMCA